MTLTLDDLKFYLCEEIEETKDRLLKEALSFEDILSQKGKLRSLERVLAFVISPNEQAKFRNSQDVKKAGHLV